jgi:hypothetical protein
MREFGNSRARLGKSRVVVSVAAALLGVAVLCQPDLAGAAPHGGGGGFHGGGFHGGFHGSGGFAGFHGNGFHPGAFHGEGFRGGVAGFHNGFGDGHEGHWYHGWHNGRYGWWLVGPGLAWSYYTYPWWGSYPGYDYDYDYGQYGYGQPYAGQTWYYCSDPAGYYPYVAQCNTGWQAVPAS